MRARHQALAARFTLGILLSITSLQCGDPPPTPAPASQAPDGPPPFGRFVPREFAQLPPEPAPPHAPAAPAEPTPPAPALLPITAEWQPPACEPGQMPVVAEAACQPIGPPCPPGDWPLVLPSGSSLWFVQPDGDGDGHSQETPLGELQAAIDQARDHDIVLLSKGEHLGQARIDRPITLQGTCAAGTLLKPARPNGLGKSALIHIAETAGVRVRHLQISGASGGVRVADGAHDVHFEGLWLRDLQGDAFSFSDEGTQARLTRVMIHDIGPHPSSLAKGRGVDVRNGAVVELAEVSIQRATSIGIGMKGENTRLRARRLLVSDTSPRPKDLDMGPGLGIWDGAQASLREATLLRNRRAGIHVQGEAARVQAEDLVITDTESHAHAKVFGVSLSVINGAQGQVERAQFMRNRDIGVLVGGFACSQDSVQPEQCASLCEPCDPTSNCYSSCVTEWNLCSFSCVDAQLHGRFFTSCEDAMEYCFAGEDHKEKTSQLWVRDLTVSHTRPRESDGAGGVGLLVGTPARVVMERGHFSHNRFKSVALVGKDSELVADDLIIEHTQPEQNAAINGGMARGITASGAAEAHIRRMSIRGSGDLAVASMGPGTLFDVEDLLIEDTALRPEISTGGAGFHVANSGLALVSRARLTRNGDHGFWIHGEGSVLVGDDLQVLSTRPQANSRVMGAGVRVEQGAQALLSRLRVEDAHTGGILVMGVGSLLQASDVSIQDVAEQRSDLSMGWGIGVIDGAEGHLERVTITNTHQAGLAVVGAGSHFVGSDLSISSTYSQGAGAPMGFGIGIQEGGWVSLSRVHIDRSLIAGLALTHSASVLEASDLRITRTRMNPCAGDLEAGPNCGRYGGGEGLMLRSGRCRIERFAAEDNDGIGMLLAREPVTDAAAEDEFRLELHFLDGILRGNHIGLNVQLDELDLDEAFSNVVSFANRQEDFSAAALPLPSAQVGIEELEREPPAEGAPGF